MWRRGVGVITAAELHSTKPELRFCADLNPAYGVSEIHDVEGLWQWSRLEIRLNAFHRSIIPQKKKKKKEIHHHHFTKFIAGHIKTMKGVFTNVRSKRRLCLILRYSTSFDVIWYAEAVIYTKKSSFLSFRSLLFLVSE